MTDLPTELVEEILSRVPALSLKRLRSTCKRWNVLFKDQRFTKKHFDRASKQFLVSMLHQNKFTSLTVNRHDNNPFLEYKGELGFLSHCDGLLLCTTKRDRLVVWNPCTGETKFIITNNLYEKSPMFALGYVNNKSRRNYKVLRYCSTTYNYPQGQFEIYEFSSCTWRVLEVTANFEIKPRGVSLKGNAYWLAYRRNSLLSFDFSTERLVSIPLPFNTSGCTKALSVVREEKLSLLHQRFDTKKIEVWIASSDKIDETIVLSWTRFLTVDNYRVYGYRELVSYESFFIDEEKKLVVCYCDSSRCYVGIITNVFVLGEYNVSKEFDFGEFVHKSAVFNYTPSLVQIQESLSI